MPNIDSLELGKAAAVADVAPSATLADSSATAASMRSTIARMLCNYPLAAARSGAASVAASERFSVARSSRLSPIAAYSFETISFTCSLAPVFCIYSNVFSLPCCTATNVLSSLYGKVTYTAEFVLSLRPTTALVGFAALPATAPSPSFFTPSLLPPSP